MKKVKIYSIMVFICIIGIIITISLSNKCEHKGCNNSKIKGSNYCHFFDHSDVNVFNFSSLI